ncbi:MAG: hypothetical protein SH856_07320 [Flavobacteriales bacterium]|nr:hypothetical protein [Flavobacteriales bacterium]
MLANKTGCGCDNVITVNLTVSTIDTSVTQNGLTLTSNVFGAMYHWLDCDNGFAAVSGDTNQVFTASLNGNFAVAITQNSCTDTSTCHTINGIGMTEIDFANHLNIFPKLSLPNSKSNHFPKHFFHHHS